ncbi:MAG: cupin domain-containing protein, partial [Balneolaceae bacterium]|nr:cupin domain-containing protein [Balneolaceae bacterium]
MDRIEELISFLDLKSHPEGGFFRETYRSDGMISQEELGDSFSGARHFSTGINSVLNVIKKERKNFVYLKCIFELH